jgi:hypothetical protein
MTKRQQDRYQDDDSPFENGILKDQHRSRVSMQFRDAMRNDLRRVTDGAGGSDGLQRPGFRLASKRDVRHYQDYDRWVQEAYKDAAIEPQSAITGVGSGEFGAHAREGDGCTINGSPGHINAEGKCVVDQPDWPGKRNKQDAQHDHRSRMAKLYSDLDFESSNAWRGGKS